jgi:hypothetical protein
MVDERVGAAFGPRLKTAASQHSVRSLAFCGRDMLAVWRAGRHSRQHRKPFERAARKAKLPAGTTLYALRHSSIGRALLKNVPIKIVADWHDTSVGIIEKHYARFIINSADTLICDALLDTSPPEGPAKVVTVAA